MFLHKNTTKIFSGSDLDEHLNNHREGIKDLIHREDKNSLLNANEVEYVEYFKNRYHFELLSIDFENMTVSEKEEYIDAAYFPRHFYVKEGQRYAKPVLTFHVPFTGNTDLLRLTPNPRLHWHIEIVLSQKLFTFDIVNWSNNSEEIKSRLEEIKTNILRVQSFVNQQIQSYNDHLEFYIQKTLTERKAEVLKQTNTLSALGIPLKSNQNTSQTFTISNIQKKPVTITKPLSASTPFQPEPTLSEELYQSILKNCHHIGREIERLPSVYEGKGEEPLRDHFIVFLSPHYQSVSGETFNKAGKTDILIRHEGKNVFVGECKFWKGKKQLLQTIDQILSYLTWRDSKAAILFFVDNKNITPVLESLSKDIKEHVCYVKDGTRREESWFEYHFCLPQDRTRAVRLAIQLFHFPSMK